MALASRSAHGGFGRLVGPPVAGAVIDLTDGYAAAMALSAAVVVGSWGLLRSLPGGATRGSRRVTRAGAATLAAIWTFVYARVRRFINALAAERQLQRAVRELEAMDDRRLRNLGLTRANIKRGRDRPAAA